MELVKGDTYDILCPEQCEYKVLIAQKFSEFSSNSEKLYEQGFERLGDNYCPTLTIPEQDPKYHFYAGVFRKTKHLNPPHPNIFKIF